MEMQYFIKPGTQDEAMERWKEIRFQWHVDQGLDPKKLRWHDHGEELAHYADAAFDIEYEFPIGWDEMEGIHSRTDFDLGKHAEFSGKNLNYVDQADGNKKYLPYVLETSVGCDRHILALLCDAYRIENPGEKEERVVLGFKPQMAPIKVAVMPLMKKPELTKIAQEILSSLQKKYKCEYDMAGSIGKRYRRQDEIGTPLCITVDYDSLEDASVTIRDRDTMSQERIKISDLDSTILNKFGF